MKGHETQSPFLEWKSFWLRFFFNWIIPHISVIAAQKTPDKQSTSTPINNSSATATTTSTPNHQLNSSHEESEDDINESMEADDDDDCMEHSSDGNNHKRNKKTRTVFSRAQVFQLESTFDVKK